MYNVNEGLLYYLLNKDLGMDPILQYAILVVSFTLISMAAGYFLGSINSAIVVSKLLYGDDIRKHGSGNAGLTNMLRTYGTKAAALTLAGDLAKTAIAVLIGCFLGGFAYVGAISLSGINCDVPLPYIAGFFAILGHILPIYYKFKGGKGVLCTAVMAMILTPIEFLILLLIFILMVVWTKYVSLASVTAAVLYPVAVSGHIKVLSSMSGGAIGQNGLMALITILIAIIIVYCHRENLQRVSQGTERKISIGKPKHKDGEN